MDRMRVLLLQGTLMHYRVPCWNIMADNYDLTIGFYDRDQTIDCECLFKKIRFDITHIGPFILVKGVRKLAKNFDVVIVMPDFHVLTYISIPFLPHKYKLLTWSIGFRVSYIHPYLITRPHNFADKLFELLLRQCDANIFYMEKSKEFWLNTKVDLNKVFAAPNTTSVLSIDIDVDRKNNILFVGTLYRGKGVDKLIESFAEAKKRVNSNIKLDIIGAGEMMDDLKSMAAALGLESNVNFVGPVYDETVLASYFQKALLCISPSQGGLSCPKSMGYGVPFVTRKDAITGGEIYHMTPGVDGIMYEDDADLTDIIIDAYSNKGKYLKMGMAAKEYYDHNATPYHMAQGAMNAINFINNKNSNCIK